MTDPDRSHRSPTGGCFDEHLNRRLDRSAGLVTGEPLSFAKVAAAGESILRRSQRRRLVVVGMTAVAAVLILGGVAVATTAHRPPDSETVVAASPLDDVDGEGSPVSRAVPTMMICTDLSATETETGEPDGPDLRFLTASELRAWLDESGLATFDHGAYTLSEIRRWIATDDPESLAAVRVHPDRSRALTALVLTLMAESPCPPGYAPLSGMPSSPGPSARSGSDGDPSSTPGPTGPPDLCATVPVATSETGEVAVLVVNGMSEQTLHPADTPEQITDRMEGVSAPLTEAQIHAVIEYLMGLEDPCSPVGRGG